MTNAIQDFTKGSFKSYFNSLMLTTKHSDRPNSSNISLFFEPIITTLCDSILILDLKKLIEICNEKNLLKQNPRQVSLVFLGIKEALYTSLNLLENTLNEDLKNILEKSHKVMDKALPVISAIAVIASMNLALIAGYFLQIGLIYLQSKENLSVDARSICHYSSLTLNLCSIIHLSSSSSLFQKGIKLSLN